MMVQEARGHGPAVSILALLCGVWAPAAHAQSWSWSYTASTPNRVDAHPSAVSRPDARGFWALGDSVLHFHPDGTLDFANNHPRLGEGFAGGSLSDASLIYANVPYPSTGGFGGEWPPVCSIYRLAPDGTPRWGVNLWWGNCRKVAVDGHDVVWVQDDVYATLTAFAADGVLQVGSSDDTPVDFYRTVDFAVARTSGGVFIATLDNTIVAYDDNGQLQWRWTDPNAAAALDRIALGGDGNIYVAGRADRSANGGALHIVSLTPAGQQRFVVDAVGSNVNAIYAMSALAGGGFYLIDRRVDAATPQIFTLQRIAADGSVVWSRPQASVIGCTNYLPDCALSTTVENDALFSVLRNPVTNWVVRYDSNGTLLHDVSLDRFYLLGSLVSRDNGNALLTSVDSDLHPALKELDRHGKSATPPVTTKVLVDDAGGSAYLANDGSSYLSVDDVAGHSTVKLDRDGNVAWKTPRVAERVFSYLSQGGNRVCNRLRLPLSAMLAWDTDYRQELHCFETSDGTEAWSMTIDPTAGSASPMRALEDGSVVLLHWSASAYEHVLFDASGVELHRTVITDLGNSWFNLDDSIAANGTTVIMTRDWRLLAYDRNAAKLYDVSVPGPIRATDTFIYPTVQALADGSTVVTMNQYSGDGYAALAWVVDAAGNTRWLSRLDDPNLAATRGYTVSAPATEGNSDRLYFTLHSPVSAEAAPRSVTLSARSRSNGQLLWNSVNVASDWEGSRLLANPAGGGLVLLSRNIEKLSIASIDADTGAVRQQREQSCSDDVPLGGAAGFRDLGCSLPVAALTTDDTLRVYAASGSSTGPVNERLYALRNASARPVAVRLDQPGLNGAWYPAYSGGQGFMFDYIASEHTLFMPWFTFELTQDTLRLFGVNDPSGLAWYGLQGSVGADARSVNLVIAVTDAGSFNSGIVTGRTVGTAYLRLSDCNNATLFYQFDAGTNGGAGGLISLSRLTPATSPCLLADGSVTPAQNTNPPAQGFDARQSGSWFDPATGGQGIEMTIIPAGNGSNGVVFAAWFTFDPAGQSDDPIHQHWFTLQGDLANAVEGKVTLPIYRIIGGAFDGAPTGNFAQVGNATLTMQGCDSVQLDYRFDSAEVVHAFAGLAGTSHLIKIGGCSAQ